MNTEKEIWKFLRLNGLTEEGAAGLIGNLYAESGLVPNRVEMLCLTRLSREGRKYNDATYTSAVDSGEITRDGFLHPLPGKQYGYGLAQWTSPGRKAGLYDMAKQLGVSIGDLWMQLTYLIQELRTSYKSVYDTLCATNSVKTASDEVLVRFECPADCGEDAKARRASYGKKYYEKYKDTEEEDMSKTEKATQQMEAWAKDDSHGYDQAYRWGQKGDYDCSAAVIQAWENAGVPVKTNGATYTGNMLPVFLGCGFVDVTASVNRSTGAGLQRGDVLLNTSHHTAMYCGDGKEVEASINEKGTVTGGKPGDQTGKEFLIRSYRNYPWTHVLRYQEETEGECEVKLKRLAKGSKGNQVKTVQRILRELGYKGKDGKELNVDGDFGKNTEYALIAFQKAQEFKPTSGKYGICAAGTWKLLINAA